ncbi:hypothetical protein [Streptomyces wuyuanensis]|uniref:hypothetical protein n=1 Tax=Streptomyces wuyuanensis TaxID=1196353 RepID=UPI003794FB36
MTDTTTAERDPLDIARDAIPGFRDVQTADAAVQQRLAELRGAAATPADLGAETFAAVTAGGPVPGDLGRRAWEAQQADEFRTAELQILMGVEKRLQNHGENTLRAGADEGLHALRPVLDELLDRARPMAAALRGVNDAQGAIDRGPDAVAAWSGIAGVVSRYAAIRNAQRTLSKFVIGDSVGTRYGSIGFRGIFNVWSEIENVTEIWPEWTPARSDGQTARPPWPVLYTHKPFEVQHDREWLLWLLSSPRVRLWVPTVDELTAAYVRQRDDAQQREDETPKQRSTGEPRRRPVHTRDADGDTHVEFETIED